MSAVLKERLEQSWKEQLRSDAENLLPKIEYNLNVPITDIVENTRHALTLDLPQAEPHDIQDAPIAVVCGGPSLKEFFPLLQQKHSDGMKVVSVNGTHDWLMERGIRPSAHIQIDAREFNSRFVKNWHPDTKYIIASQSHPKTFEALKGANVTIFHCISAKEEFDILDEHYHLNRWEEFYTVPGGSTAALRGISVLRLLGFTRMEMFGFDSCIMDGEHHSYQQDENDSEEIGTIKVGDREFQCHPWMHSQANEFLRMVKDMGKLFELVVHGDGLIAHLIKIGAELYQEK